ncbi:MAG TPA: hypothetical protein VLV16_03160 [Gemmatimonadales bacterium]|nr:hypothetical protein [Gemmatimonadales bacterium]
MTDRPKRSGNDRRRYPNRRGGVDRRVEQDHMPEEASERRGTPDRRGNGDRRKWVERRGRKPS